MAGLSGPSQRRPTINCDTIEHHLRLKETSGFSNGQWARTIVASAARCACGRTGPVTGLASAIYGL